MDRLTLKEGLCNMASTEFCFAQKDCYTCPHGRKCFKRLAAYEDTGLTPAEVVILKARSEKESFIDHLNMLCDMKDKQISELFHENQRLKKIISDIADIIRKEKD